MAITDTTVFDTVVVSCSCNDLRVSTVYPRDGAAVATGAEAIKPTTTDTDEIAQLDIMRDAVIAGTAVVVYRDGSTEYDYDDLPFEFALIHTLHSIHPEAGWKSTGTLVLNADVEEDSDTGRSDILTQFGVIPEKRTPDGSTFAYPLDRWNVRLVVGTDVAFQRDWTAEDNVTAPNDEDDVIGMLAWLESIRTSGDPVGDSILAIDDLANRTFEIDQGGELPVLELDIGSRGHHVDDGVYSHVGFTMQRITGETDDIHIDAIREIVMDATGTITVASDDAPEEPPFGSTNVRILAKDIGLPDNKRIEVVGDRVVLWQPSLGRTPLDGSGRRIARYTDLDDQDVAGTVKYMPSDGARVVHFGHDATADGTLQFRDDLSDHTLSESIGEVYEVRNISAEYDVAINAPSPSGILVNLKPGQQCSFEVAESNADGNEEIIVVGPPSRRIVWSRGLALPNLAGQNLWNADSASWMALPWPTSAGLNYIDTDGFTIGSATPAASAPLSTVAIADWDIPGSFQIDHPGLVHLDIEYELVFNVDPPTDLAAVLGPGHGVSLWISEGGDDTLSREQFIGLAEMSAIGDRALCAMRYTGSHSENTRFLILHRIPSSTSVIGTNADVDAYLEQIEMEALFSSAELDPTIRWVSS